MRINAGARANGLSYNQFIAGLKAAESSSTGRCSPISRSADPAKFGEHRRAGQAGARRNKRRSSSRRSSRGRPSTATAARRSTPSSVAGSRTIRGSAHSLPTSTGTSRCACSAALHYLVLAGEASWDDVGAALEQHAEFLRAVHRGAGGADERGAARVGAAARRSSRSPTAGRSTCSSSARRPGSTSSGTATATATRRARGATARSSSPATTGRRRRPSCSSARVSVARRRGIDLNPVDATTDHGARLLQAFVWADQAERLERLRRAIEEVRADPPELMRGDYVESLPALLARPPRRRAARRLPDGVDDVPRARRHRARARRARSEAVARRAARLRRRPAARPTTTASRSRSSATPAAAGSGSASSTSTASGSTGASESIRRPAGFGDRPPRCPSSLRCRRTSSCGRGRPGRGTPASTSSS